MRISDWSSDVCSSDFRISSRRKPPCGERFGDIRQYSARSIGGRDEMQGICVRMNDGIDLTVYAQNEMRILGEDTYGTLAMRNHRLRGRIIMAYGDCHGTDGKSVELGKNVSVSVVMGGESFIKNTTRYHHSEQMTS